MPPTTNKVVAITGASSGIGEATARLLAGRGAAVAIGADGIIAEMHPNPSKAISDGAQSLDIPMFRQMMRDIQPYLRIWKESREAESLAVAV